MIKKMFFIIAPLLLLTAVNVIAADQKVIMDIKGMDNPICNCFGFTAEDIKMDIAKNGRSLIMEKITEEKRLNGCDCATRNPKGR